MNLFQNYLKNIILILLKVEQIFQEENKAYRLQELFDKQQLSNFFKQQLLTYQNRNDILNKHKQIKINIFYYNFSSYFYYSNWSYYFK